MNEKIMRVNPVSFSGILRLKNPELWTDGMKAAIAGNKSIQKKLEDNDIIGEISVKVEKKVPQYYSFHHKGDLLYKVNFIAKKDNASIPERLRSTQKYSINKHYHSEHTTVSRIENLKMD